MVRRTDITICSVCSSWEQNNRHRSFDLTIRYYQCLPLTCQSPSTPHEHCISHHLDSSLLIRITHFAHISPLFTLSAGPHSPLKPVTVFRHCSLHCLVVTVAFHR